MLSGPLDEPRDPDPVNEPLATLGLTVLKTDLKDQMFRQELVVVDLQNPSRS
jgi:hypothetical protein